MTIAERIRLYRQQKNLSQAELAEISGVNNKSLSRYELDTSIPPADALKAIADALGVSTDALLSDDIIAIKDKELLKRFQAIQDMDSEDKAMVVKFLDLAIRDAKTKKAYTNIVKVYILKLVDIQMIHKILLLLLMAILIILKM